MRRSSRAVPLVVVALGAFAGRAAAADEARRAPIPEPIFGESVTDIDGFEVGEIEVDADAAELRSRRGGGQLQLASVEAEWLVLRRLGLRVEPTLVHAAGAGADPRTEASVGTTVAWKLVQDVARDLYVQAELGADWPPRGDALPSPDESGLPFVLDVRAAWRRDLWTLRGSLGAAAGGTSPHAPVRGSLALLMSLDRTSRTGFFGVEAVADGTWIAPVYAAPNVVADLSPLGLPVRLGLALPWAPGAGDTRPSIGVLLRLIVEPLRDLASEQDGVSREAEGRP